MQRIRLTKREKKVLRLLHNDCGCLDTYPDHVFSACVGSLERKGPAKGAWVSGHELASAELTDLGEYYLRDDFAVIEEPANHTKVWAMVSIAAALEAVATLVIKLIWN